MKNVVRSASLVLLVLIGACGGGPPEPPSLEYQVPADPIASYDVTDTTVVSVSMMGQSMELSQHGTGLYSVSFAPAPEGVTAELTVVELAATINQPMGAPVQVDESYVTGPLLFSLDRQGNATVTDQPDVRAEASQMVSGLDLAHGFFPGLPGRAALPGDSWTDTVRFEGEEGPGMRSETSVLNYGVVRDTVVDGRPILVISVEGMSSISNAMELSGMTISQESEVDVRGELLWDPQMGLMVESRRTASGRGTVSVPVAPAPLPIVIESTQTARLRAN